jgi:hypothetical protein
MHSIIVLRRQLQPLATYGTLSNIETAGTVISPHCHGQNAIKLLKRDRVPSQMITIHHVIDCIARLSGRNHFEYAGLTLERLLYGTYDIDIDGNSLLININYTPKAQMMKSQNGIEIKKLKQRLGIAEPSGAEKHYMMATQHQLLHQCGCAVFYSNTITCA